MDMNGLLGFEHLDLGSVDGARDVVVEAFSKIGGEGVPKTAVDIDMRGLLGFENLELKDHAGAEAAVSETHSKIGGEGATQPLSSTNEL